MPPKARIQHGWMGGSGVRFLRSLL
jgi:hypothetical protein